MMNFFDIVLEMLYEDIFPEVLNLSLVGSVVILFVLLLRLLLRKAPKKYSYFLWIFAGIRLICPVVLPAFGDWFPVRQDAFVYEKLAYGKPQIQTGLLRADYHISNFLQTWRVTAPSRAEAGSINPLQVYMCVGAILWVLVMAVLLIRQIVRYILWKRKLSLAVRVEKTDIYESDKVDSPLLFGIWKPIIYVPVGMPEPDRSHAIAHERVHKKRKDYLVKLIANGILLVHWFNPLCWLAFYCMVIDMEMSCDEAVLKKLDERERIGYGEALVNESLKKSGLGTLNALGFGRGVTKKRLKNVLKYKKQAVIITVICVLLVLVSGIFLLSGRGENDKSFSIIGGADGPTAIFLAAKWSGSQEVDSVPLVIYYSDAWFQVLCDYRHLYVGDASMNGKILGYAGQSLPEEWEWAGQELQTSQEPYEIHANYTVADFETLSEQDLILANLRHSAIVFATIENADIASLGLVDSHGNEKVITHTREQLEELLGMTELYEKSENTETLKEYMNYVAECLTELVQAN